MPSADKGSEIAPMVRNVISAWVVFLTMFLGAVLYSIIDSSLSDPAGPPVAGNQVVTVEDFRVEPASEPMPVAQIISAESDATE